MKTTSVVGTVKAQYIQNFSWMISEPSHLSNGIEKRAAKNVPGRNNIVMTAIAFIAELSCTAFKESLVVCTATSCMSLLRAMLTEASVWVIKPWSYFYFSTRISLNWKFFLPPLFGFSLFQGDSSHMLHSRRLASPTPRPHPSLTHLACRVSLRFLLKQLPAGVSLIWRAQWRP